MDGNLSRTIAMGNAYLPISTSSPFQFQLPYLQCCDRSRLHYAYIKDKLI